VYLSFIKNYINITQAKKRLSGRFFLKLVNILINH